ncbi:hypothetical protein F5Y10DRAFT_260491 [Nemania abortiva]|nr:hypothetical protein F5Y10DRAFT_260491 [Nemania abortiva]
MSPADPRVSGEYAGSIDSHELPELKHASDKDHQLLLVSPAGTCLHDLHLVNRYDRREILDWNGALPETPQDTLHDMFRGIVRDRPEDEAVGPDGHLTYGQVLDAVSDSIAEEPQRGGISPEASRPSDSSLKSPFWLWLPSLPY